MSLLSRFGKKKRKKKRIMHILWCFIVKGCVNRPARFRTLIFFFHSRVVVFFCLFFFQLTSRVGWGWGGIQRARQVDRACWTFFQLRPFGEKKGSRNSGKHLWPVQVAHIRPLCCRCVGLLTPHRGSQRDAICDAFFVSGNFICVVFVCF